MFEKATPAILWTTDRELRLTALAGAELQDMGASADSYLGSTIDSLFSDAGSELLDAHGQALLGKRSSFIIQTSRHTLTGWVEPQRGINGVVTGVIGVALDDDVRANAEQSFRSLIEEIPYAICRVSKCGRLLQVNRAMLNLLGYDVDSEAELLARLLPSDIIVDHLGFEKLLNKLAKQETFHGLEGTWRCRSGLRIDVRLAGKMVSNDREGIAYLDLLIENVTERKHLEEQWRQAQKLQAIGQLAGGIAHDFNNLLMVIEGQVELMLAERLEPGIQQRLDEVMLAADRASYLTRQLLAFSRRQVMQNKILDLNAVIGDMSQMLSRVITKNVELTFIPSQVPVCVRADASHIEQVMVNLAVNARDAMPTGGRLTIEISTLLFNPSAAGSKGEEYATISVRDTGIGMDEEVQARIFEPFFTTKRPGSGNGLGLSLVYGVVSQSGGEIQVESEMGKGSVFRICLPRVSPAAPATTERAAAALRAGPETILYAEDEETVRELVAFYLTTLGYNVLSASDGVLAMKAAQSYNGHIDLLLSDVMMPNMGGRDLGEELRKMIPGLKIILVSGYAGENFELPRAHFLSKPFSMQTLSKKLREVLDDSSS